VSLSLFQIVGVKNTTLLLQANCYLHFTRCFSYKITFQKKKLQATPLLKKENFSIETSSMEYTVTHAGNFERKLAGVLSRIFLTCATHLQFLKMFSVSEPCVVSLDSRCTG